MHRRLLTNIGIVLSLVGYLTIWPQLAAGAAPSKAAPGTASAEKQIDALLKEWDVPTTPGGAKLGETLTISSWRPQRWA